jgi:flagellar basal-body rod modification protein FlgD
MAVQNVNAAAAASTATNPLKNQVASQDDFLKLLITQLQNQDPLQPMDNQEFAAQLATFNSLGQLIEINEKLGAVNSGQGSMNQYNAASLIGKQITSAGNQVGVSAGAASNIGYQLGANATKVEVTVFDANGEIVRRLDAGARGAGEQSLVWDGKDSTGKSVRPGVYGFDINAVDVNGKKIAASGKLQGLVTGVRLDGTEPVLEVNGVDVPLSSVIAVRASR